MYYRICTSSNAEQWLNYEYSTPDNQASSAPSIQITGVTTGTTPSTTLRPSITGPASRDRSASAPTFQINPGANRYYAVEVATQANLFDQNGHGSERNSSNFYASWQDTPLMDATTYTLPTAVWDRLKNASTIYYRICTSSSGEQWLNYEYSTPDSQASSAPSMQLTGYGRTIAGKLPTEPGPDRPWIVGPEKYERGAVAPSFSINPGANRYYAVEVATDTSLFCGAHYSAERTADNFFSSLQLGLLECNGETVYTLPTDVWQHLRGAERIFFRVITSATPDNRTNYDYSTTDDNCDEAPWINLRGGTSKKEDLTSPDVQLPLYTQDRTANERLWRK